MAANPETIAADADTIPPAIETLEAFDNFSGLRNALRDIAAKRSDWAGIPMPLEDVALVVEPSYPGAKELELIGKTQGDYEDAKDLRHRNSFWSTHRRCTIHVVHYQGRVQWTFTPGVHGFDHQIQTLAASCAWGIEQESKALQMLAGLVKHHTFKQYLLTGMFMESSARSGVTYLFRKLRPTVAIKARKGRMRILAALCLHPIAYYQGSWAGAMCPTDDVIAHLMLMRGDEHMFWRRANQHAAHRPEAGL